MAQATLGPFIYDDAGFQVQVTVGSGTQYHSCMDCEQLYALITSSKSHAVPYGTSSGFYAAQLQHYGLPVPTSSWPNNVAQALETFKAVFKLKDGKHKLSVPASISSIKKKLKDEYEDASLKTKEARVATIEAELEKARKAEESLAKKLKSLQADLKGKKRKAVASDLLQPAGQHSAMASTTGDKRAMMSADVAISENIDPPKKKKKVEQAHGKDVAAFSAPKSHSEIPDNCEENVRNDATSEEAAGQSDASESDSAGPQASHNNCASADQQKAIAKKLRRKLAGVWKISTRIQPEGTAGWIAIAKIAISMPQIDAQASHVSPVAYFGRFYLNGVTGDFYCRESNSSLVGESLKVAGAWECCRADALTTFADLRPTKGHMKRKLGKIELFFDGNRLDGYLTEAQRCASVVTFESYGAGEGFVGHSFATSWAESAWKRLKHPHSGAKAKKDP